MPRHGTTSFGMNPRHPSDWLLGQISLLKPLMMQLELFVAARFLSYFWLVVSVVASLRIEKRGELIGSILFFSFLSVDTKKQLFGRF